MSAPLPPLWIPMRCPAYPALPASFQNYHQERELNDPHHVLSDPEPCYSSFGSNAEIFDTINMIALSAKEPIAGMCREGARFEASSPLTSSNWPQSWVVRGLSSSQIPLVKREIFCEFEGFGKKRPIPSRCGIYADSASHGHSCSDTCAT